MSEFATNGKRFESVWDYPRPPRIERVAYRIRVVHASETIIDAPEALRVLETSQAPAYYVAPEHVDDRYMSANTHRTFCEWKGVAAYADVVVGDRVAARAAWTYPEPTVAFRELTGYWACYAQSLDECWIDDEQVDPNDGDFYGGWITSNVTGPFKGAPGTATW